MEEIEIKFAVKDTKAVTERLRKLGFRIAIGRHREKNYLFDDGSGNLQTLGKLLRVRKTPSSQTVTYKGPILATSKLKHREEIECRIENADTMIRILEEVGFKVRFNIYDEVALNQKRRERDFHADSTAASYRWDPDGWFSRQILSTAPATKANSGFHNERADQLIAAARGTVDRQKRLELYAAIDSIVNAELPILYLHHLTLLEAGSLRLKGYQPSVSGAFSTRGGGIRTAWME